MESTLKKSILTIKNTQSYGKKYILIFFSL